MISMILDYILEYKDINANLKTITPIMPGASCYNLYAIKNTWIFPWKVKTIQLNIEELHLPYQTIGVIMGLHTPNNKFEVLPEMVLDTKEPLSIRVRNLSILPRRVKAGNVIAHMSIIQSKQCHILKLN